MLSTKKPTRSRKPMKYRRRHSLWFRFGCKRTKEQQETDGYRPMTYIWRQSLRFRFGCEKEKNKKTNDQWAIHEGRVPYLRLAFTGKNKGTKTYQHLTLFCYIYSHIGRWSSFYDAVMLFVQWALICYSWEKRHIISQGPFPVRKSTSTGRVFFLNPHIPL